MHATVPAAPVADHAVSAVPARCANCEAVLTGPYCAQCGQHAHIETPTLWEFIHEYLHHYVALEGKLGRSLMLLLFRPGRLTLEFLAGRRTRYVKPLQMYLTFSVIFFIALNLSGLGAGKADKPADKPAAEQAGQSAQAKEAAGADRQAAQAPAASKAPPPPPPVDGEKLPPPPPPADSREPPPRPASAGGDARDGGFNLNIGKVDSPWAARWNATMAERRAEFETDPDRAMKRIGKVALSYAPYGVFFLLPVYALLLWLMYFPRKLRYGAHLVYAFHVHAFLFLVFNLLLLPLPGWLTGAVSLLVPLYFLVAMKTMYGGRWPALLARAALLAILYLFVAAFTIVALLALAMVA